MSQVFCSIEYICFRKASGSNTGAPNFLPRVPSSHAAPLGVVSLTHKRTRRKPPGLKNVRANSVFRSSRSSSKILNDKKYMFNTVNSYSGHTLFSGQAQSCSKILNVKSIFTTVKNSRANSFSGHVQSCSKILNGKKYIQYSEKTFWADSVFQASASCSKILNGEKLSNTVYSVYIHLGLIRLIWAGVACNLDESRVTVKFLLKKKFLNVKTLIITVRFLVWEKTSRKELHSLELTSKVTAEFAYNGISRGIHKKRY